jgi:ribonuclease HII
MLWVGVDENGMGPLLGPLVATAVSIDVEAYAAGALRRRGKRLGIGDSKQTTAFGAMRDAESLALALAERELGAPLAHADDFVDALSLDGRLALQEICPDGASRSQCWSAALALPAFGGDANEGRKVLAKLERRGLRVVRVRTALACAGMLNVELAFGRNKVDVDLGLMERLVLDARGVSDAPLDAICGIVGGLRTYMPRFRGFDTARTTAIEESRKRCAYDIEPVGRVSFEVDADDTHLPVALASMVGKYVRELQMARLNAFYGSHVNGLTEASGYRDPVTKRFILATAETRRILQIADACFERVR